MESFRSMLHDFLPFSPLSSLTNSCSVWFERSLHSLTNKTDDVTIGRKDEDSFQGMEGTSNFK